MRGAVMVAVVAAIGNLLQGWDNATIAGAVLYVKKEFKLESEPTIEGLIVAMSLIGATCITTCSGAISDWIGRRPLLIMSSVLYFLSGLVMIWSPNVYVLLLGRLLDGFGVGLAVTLVPVYISETAPAETRGLLNTLPQFTGSTGMFLSYCMVFGMSLMTIPNWRLMLGVLSILSLVYFALIVLFLPESPRWLVSKGRISEAEKVLQRLRGREDVAAEMALLVEGLGVGGETSIEEYIIRPANSNGNIEDPEISSDKDRIKLLGVDPSLSRVAKPVTEHSTLSTVDPVVTLFENVHETLPENESLRSVLLPTAKAPSWNNIFEPGVEHALIVGVGIQILQQFSGINGVLYYTPQILDQAGVGFLISNIGISSSSASLLISGVTTLLMLPSIAVGMRLMDIAGRRSLLLTTIPILIVSLIVLVIGTVVEMGNIANAALSTISVTLYFCIFVMGFGPIPNILCAEIFPTRVRGTCIAVCALTFWICNIIVTYSLPILLRSVGLAGVFSMYAVVCVVSWVFVFVKVPETKGMPLEVIMDFFTVGCGTC
ncbi:hypothetical protein GQ457_13G006690 [Hibiscus cannabinus]